MHPVPTGTREYSSDRGIPAAAPIAAQRTENGVWIEVLRNTVLAHRARSPCAISRRLAGSESGATMQAGPVGSDILRWWQA